MKTGRMKEVKEEQVPLLPQSSRSSKREVYLKDNLVKKEENLPVPLPVNYQAGCEVKLTDLHLDAKVKTQARPRWGEWTKKRIFGRGAVP